MEPILLVLSIYAFLMLAFGRRWWHSLRDARREKLVRRLCHEVFGEEIARAYQRFGEPFAVLPGADRRLHEWKSPPATTFPRGSGLLIFYLVENEEGRVVHASWETRTEERWRSGSYSG